MKRRFAFLLTLCLGWSVFLGGCGGTLPKPDGRLQVVCTIFPEYDWARQLTREVVLKSLCDSQCYFCYFCYYFFFLERNH